MIAEMNLGMFGAGLATSGTYSLNLVLIRLLFTCYSDLGATVNFPGWNSFYYLKDYAKVAFPTLVIQCYMIWFTQFGNLFSRYMSIEEIKAQ